MLFLFPASVLVSVLGRPILSVGFALSSPAGFAFLGSAAPSPGFFLSFEFWGLFGSPFWEAELLASPGFWFFPVEEGCFFAPVLDFSQFFPGSEPGAEPGSVPGADFGLSPFFPTEESVAF